MSPVVLPSLLRWMARVPKVRDHADNRLTYSEYPSAPRIRPQSCCRSHWGGSTKSGRKQFVSVGTRQAERKKGPGEKYSQQHTGTAADGESVQVSSPSSSTPVCSSGELTEPPVTHDHPLHFPATAPLSGWPQEAPRCPPNTLTLLCYAHCPNTL